MFFSPVLSVIPTVATAPALVIVGVYMIRPVIQIDWQDLEEAIPAFLAMILIPFSYSITQGIIWGFLSWTLFKIAQGKFKEISITLLIIDALAILSLLTGIHA
jgi:AGZA family xanthine/uracil permease-like MFS transporter